MAPEYKPLIKFGKWLEEEKVSSSSLSYMDHNENLRLEASQEAEEMGYSGASYWYNDVTTMAG